MIPLSLRDVGHCTWNVYWVDHDMTPWLQKQNIVTLTILGYIDPYFVIYCRRCSRCSHFSNIFSSESGPIKALHVEHP